MPRSSKPRAFSNLIGGKLVAASSGLYLDSFDPSTGQVWAQIPRCSARDAEAAVTTAREALPAWSALSAIERAAFLRKIGDKVGQHADALAEMETRDNGWIVVENRYGLIPVLQNIWYDAAGLASMAARGESMQISPTTFAYTRREPLGVVVGIIPWNAPLFTFTLKAAYALAAGNTVIIKPSEHASVSSLFYGELLADCLPPGVLNIVSGLGQEVGETLVSHRKVNRVTLTGSIGTARAIARSAAVSSKPLTLELGGKSPNIVFADADLEKAAAGVTTNGIFTGNAGQFCVSGSRILIQRPVFDEMIERMTAHIRSIRLGDPLSADTSMGPIANKQHYDKVCSYIELGLKEGGELISGGRFGGEKLLVGQEAFAGGYWVEPTLFRVPDNALRICQEEIFGPVAAVMPFDTVEEAIAIANDTNFGLGAGVWTANVNLAARMTRELEAGNVWVNTYRYVGTEMPFGGVKDSGFGTDSIMENTRERSCFFEMG